ncbi:nucleolar protein 14 [Jimgerdemannia flammicorona]|uniref:Nucleolar protein 14 n=1 Tax=Jimgerdemannia flammicorona TaxID=994334 RepID=A0A433DES1_9FUNG|nr:nucleolar protein 14 [Jimgerdemannia flammicorona]
MGGLDTPPRTSHLAPTHLAPAPTPPLFAMSSSKASALKRLKSSLKAAGAIGPGSRASTSKKDRKKGKPNDAANRNDVARKLDAIKHQMNPFEMKTTHTKFDILGRRVKGSVGRPTLTKQVGDDNRKKTLLVEMNRKNKAGGIVDRRFGENDPTLTAEERMLERFTREKQKRARGGTLFNLDDDEDLTHYGQSLANIDDFDEADLGLSDEDDKGTIDNETVSRSHFGGFVEPPSEVDAERHKKSKGEVMKEVITKSKFFKHERQKEKEEDEDLRKELDDGLDDIRDLLFTSDGAASDKDKPKRRPLPSQTRIFERAEDEAAQAGDEDDDDEEGEDEDALDDEDVKTLRRAVEASRADPVAQPKDEYEDYDRFVRELAFDRRAQPQDRMKSEEEVAAEEKAKLEKAERMRKRRMEGLEDEDDEEEEEADTRKGRKGRKSKKQRIPEADDLEDDFMAEEMEEEAGRLGRSLTVEDIMNAKRKEEDESEEEKGDEDEEEGEDEGEYESDYSDLSLEKGSGDDCDDSEDENGEAGDVFADSGDDMIDLSGKTLTITSKKLKPVITNGTGASPTTVRKTADGTRELPYVFPCPMTHRAFVAMFRAHDVHVEDEPIIVQRIRTLYHIKLAQENLQKLETFFAILLEHLVLLASPSSSALPAHLPLATLSRHARHLFELAQQMPEHAAVIFVERLRGMQAAFLHERVVPGLAEVVVLRVLGQVFPTSDFQHPVATPAMLFVGQCLEQGKVATEADVAKKIVLAQVLYEYQTISKRFLPEPLNFLISALVLLTPKPAFPGPTIPGTFPLLEGEAPNLRLERPDLEPAPLDAMALLATDGSGAGDPQRVRASLISASLAALDSYTLLYSSTPAFVEVFGPVVEVVREMKTAVEGRWSTKIEKQITALEDRLTRQLKFAKDRRQINPLKLQSHKPVPIATFVPKFEEGYSIDRHYDPDMERAQRAKLKAQYTKERKGAIRELRKDGMFVARERLRKTKEKDAAYKKMVTGVMTVLEGEQAEKNRLEREKEKEKKRR